MVEFLAAGENLPFSAALGVMLGLTLIEALGVLFGASIAGALDNLVPDIDLDADAAFDNVMGWLHFGRVPLLVLLIVFLTAFGLIGLLVQSFAVSLTGRMLPGLLASVPAFLLALPTVRVMGSIIARIMPKDESSAVSEDSLVGRIAVLTLGVARRGQPAEARLRDQHGQSHYVMVEPDVDGDEFIAGAEVLLVRRLGARYTCIRNPHPALVDSVADLRE